nr:uncharacterized protein LOC128699011 [Cherax quadricarinatus]XP_053647503.1 uncharacterized protein LOC128699011 [Cherax quadricarinatus]
MTHSQDTECRTGIQSQQNNVLQPSDFERMSCTQSQHRTVADFEGFKQSVKDQQAACERIHIYQSLVLRYLRKKLSYDVLSSEERKQIESKVKRYSYKLRKPARKSYILSVTNKLSEKEKLLQWKLNNQNSSNLSLAFVNDHILWLDKAVKALKSCDYSNLTLKPSSYTEFVKIVQVEISCNAAMFFNRTNRQSTRYLHYQLPAGLKKTVTRARLKKLLMMSPLFYYDNSCKIWKRLSGFQQKNDTREMHHYVQWLGVLDIRRMWACRGLHSHNHEIGSLCIENILCSYPMMTSSEIAKSICDSVYVPMCEEIISLVHQLLRSSKKFHHCDSQGIKQASENKSVRCLKSSGNKSANSLPEVTSKNKESSKAFLTWTSIVSQFAKKHSQESGRHSLHFSQESNSKNKGYARPAPASTLGENQKRKAVSDKMSIISKAKNDDNLGLLKISVATGPQKNAVSCQLNRNFVSSPSVAVVKPMKDVVTLYISAEGKSSLSTEMFGECDISTPNTNTDNISNNSNKKLEKTAVISKPQFYGTCLSSRINNNTGRDNKREIVGVGTTQCIGNKHPARNSYLMQFHQLTALNNSRQHHEVSSPPKKFNTSYEYNNNNNNSSNNHNNSLPKKEILSSNKYKIIDLPPVNNVDSTLFRKTNSKMPSYNTSLSELNFLYGVNSNQRIVSKDHINIGKELNSDISSIHKDTAGVTMTKIDTSVIAPLNTVESKTIHKSTEIFPPVIVSDSLERENKLAITYVNMQQLSDVHNAVAFIPMMVADSENSHNNYNIISLTNIEDNIHTATSIATKDLKNIQGKSCIATLAEETSTVGNTKSILENMCVAAHVTMGNTYQTQEDTFMTAAEAVLPSRNICEVTNNDVANTGNLIENTVTSSFENTVDLRNKEANACTDSSESEELKGNLSPLVVQAAIENWQKDVCTFPDHTYTKNACISTPKIIVYSRNIKKKSVAHTDHSYGKHVEKDSGASSSENQIFSQPLVKPVKEKSGTSTNENHIHSQELQSNSSLPKSQSDSEDILGGYLSCKKRKKSNSHWLECYTYTDVEKEPEPKKKKTLKKIKKKFENFDTYRLPLEIGWIREVVIRLTTSHSKCDIYYHPPLGKKLRSLIEINKYLESSGVENLTGDNFTFKKCLLGFGEPFEVSRYARYKCFSNVEGPQDIPVKECKLSPQYTRKDLHMTSPDASKQKSKTPCRPVQRRYCSRRKYMGKAPNPNIQPMPASLFPEDGYWLTSFYDIHNDMETDNVDIVNEDGVMTGYEEWIMTPSEKANESTNKTVQNVKNKCDGAVQFKDAPDHRQDNEGIVNRSKARRGCEEWTNKQPANEKITDLTNKFLHHSKNDKFRCLQKDSDLLGINMTNLSDAESDRGSIISFLDFEDMDVAVEVINNNREGSLQTHQSSDLGSTKLKPNQRQTSSESHIMKQTSQDIYIKCEDDEAGIVDKNELEFLLAPRISIASNARKNESCSKSYCFEKELDQCSVKEESIVSPNIHGTVISTADRMNQRDGKPGTFSKHKPSNAYFVPSFTSASNVAKSNTDENYPKNIELKSCLNKKKKEFRKHRHAALLGDLNSKSDSTDNEHTRLAFNNSEAQNQLNNVNNITRHPCNNVIALPQEYSVDYIGIDHDTPNNSSLVSDMTNAYKEMQKVNCTIHDSALGNDTRKKNKVELPVGEIGLQNATHYSTYALHDICNAAHNKYSFVNPRSKIVVMMNPEQQNELLTFKRGKYIHVLNQNNISQKYNGNRNEPGIISSQELESNLVLPTNFDTQLIVSADCSVPIHKVAIAEKSNACLPKNMLRAPYNDNDANHLRTVESQSHGKHGEFFIKSSLENQLNYLQFKPSPSEVLAQEKSITAPGTSVDAYLNIPQSVLHHWSVNTVSQQQAEQNNQESMNVTDSNSSSITMEIASFSGSGNSTLPQHHKHPYGLINVVPLEKLMPSNKQVNTIPS